MLERQEKVIGSCIDHSTLITTKSGVSKCARKKMKDNRNSLFQMSEIDRKKNHQIQNFCPYVFFISLFHARKNFAIYKAFTQMRAEGTACRQMLTNLIRFMRDRYLGPGMAFLTSRFLLGLWPKTTRIRFVKSIFGGRHGTVLRILI